MKRRTGTDWKDRRQITQYCTTQKKFKQSRYTRAYNTQIHGYDYEKSAYLKTSPTKIGNQNSMNGSNAKCCPDNGRYHEEDKSIYQSLH